MNQVKEYKLIASFTGSDDLEKSVNEVIKEGWQPIGGMSISMFEHDVLKEGEKFTETNIILYQAMVR